MSDVLDRTTPRFVWDIDELDPADSRRFGGKATGLARMVAIGIPVPPAFAIGTDAFHAFHANKQRLPEALRDQVKRSVKRLADRIGRRFVDDETGRPLLVSVRSGSQVSMPGMMDTVLNLGLDAKSAACMIRYSGARPFVIDTWLRFWKMYAEIVLGLDGEDFAESIELQRAAAIAGTIELEALESAVVAYVAEQGEEAPTDPHVQLDRAISAVFASWDSPRAKAYRKHQGIPDDLGTAVTVQAMVFGNADERSGSGVAFSRNPNTGDPTLYGEYLTGRQGEDIVSGAKTPVDLSRSDSTHDALRAELEKYSRMLEFLYRDAVDIEFTVESGSLYLLQVRPAKRTAEAAVRIAGDLVDEGMLDPATSLKRVSVDQVKRLLRPVFDPLQLAAASKIAEGIGSSPGHASGVAILDSDRAAERASTGEAVILVRPTTSPLDIRGMIAAAGILTARGGALSHAAVVSRALDKPCIVGCDNMEIDPDKGTFVLQGRQFREGDAISIDGASGSVYDRAVDLVKCPQAVDRLSRFLENAGKLSRATIWGATAGGMEPGQQSGISRVLTNMSDVALATGEMERLLDCIRRIGTSNSGSVNADLVGLAKTMGAAIFALPSLETAHIRLPSFASERARTLLPDWWALDPRLLLPLGNPAFYRPLLEGFSLAAAESRISASILLGGVTCVAEWRRFRDEVASFPHLSAGVAVQNVACLDVASTMLDEGANLWLDMDELVRSAHGFASKHHPEAAIFDDYVSQGLMDLSPRSVPKPILSGLLGRLASGANAAESVGVYCSTSCDLTLIRTLYQQGFRIFGVPLQEREVVSMVLGQEAAIRLGFG
jgi:pyruvate, orthophosphate dikinase